MPITFRDNPTLSRFELDDAGVLAVANYRLADGVITFMHTEVPLQARGEGIASRLIAGALELAREHELKVVAIARSCGITSRNIRNFTISLPGEHGAARWCDTVTSRRSQDGYYLSLFRRA